MVTTPRKPPATQTIIQHQPEHILVPRAYIPPNLLHALEMHDRLAAADIAVNWAKSKEKKEENKEQHKKAFWILVFLVTAPIITGIYYLMFKLIIGLFIK